MTLSRLLAFMLMSSTALAQEVPTNKDCANQDWFGTAIHVYQVCLASYAEDYEISGDAADSVATAIVGACRSIENILAKDITDCGGARGRNVVDGLQGRFHDWAVQAVVEARAKRALKKKSSN